MAANTLHLIGAGAYSKRFKKGHIIIINVVKGLVNKYTKDNVAVVGHSLGGNIASAVSKKHDVEATTFSRGKGLTPNIVGKKQKAYRTYGDKLSDGAQRRHLVIPKKLNNGIVWIITFK
jgi:alpha-beta hydrolase superfamily lysophospholipase